jgi:hypothetical protein
VKAISIFLLVCFTAVLTPKQTPQIKESAPDVVDITTNNIVEDDSPDFDEIPSTDAIKKTITQKAMLLENEQKKLFTSKVKEIIGIANYNKCDDINKLEEILSVVDSM